MSWAADFYSETGRWWGRAESAIGDRDRARVGSLRRLTATTSGTMLDLGSSYGNTAAAFARAGYTVTGVEISDRIEYAQQHRAPVDAGTLTFVRADFNTFEPRRRFDLVTYWNGFGIGSDAEQRQLLSRIASDWLAPEGWVVMDVFNPVQWMAWAGDISQRAAAPDQGYPFSMSEYTDYDPCRAGSSTPGRWPVTVDSGPSRSGATHRRTYCC